MGGRLGGTGIGAGVVTPFIYNPNPNSPPHPSSPYPQMSQPQMSQQGHLYGDLAAAGAAGARGGVSPPPSSASADGYYPNTAPSSASYYPSSQGSQQQLYNPNASVPVGGYLPPSASAGAYGAGSGPLTSRTSSSGGSSHGMGMAGGPRSAKEREAMGRYGVGGLTVANPEEGDNLGEGSGFSQQQQQQRAAYMQNGPGPGAYVQNQPGVGRMRSIEHGGYVGPGAQSAVLDYAGSGASVPSPARRGSAVVVHQDGGRVQIRGKGTEAADEEEEEEPSEIPPTYDSIPPEERR